MEIGDRIKAARKAKGLTLEELAVIVKLSRQTLSRYETGIISNIPSDKIELLAEALNTSPAFLMGWTSDDPDNKESPAQKEGRAELNGAFFRLKQNLEPLGMTDDDVDFITAVYKAHKERNKPDK